jgi:hypothetical protein
LVKLFFFVKLFRMESRIPLHNFNQRVHLTKQSKRLYDLRYVKLYIKHIYICIQYCTRYKWTSSGFWISHDNKHFSNKHTFFCIFSNIDSILFSSCQHEGVCFAPEGEQLCDGWQLSLFTSCPYADSDYPFGIFKLFLGRQ